MVSEVLGGDDMKCPKCGADRQSIVLQTEQRNGQTKRRRECICGYRFRTLEVALPPRIKNFRIDIVHEKD